MTNTTENNPTENSASENSANGDDDVTGGVCQAWQSLGMGALIVIVALASIALAAPSAGVSWQASPMTYCKAGNAFTITMGQRSLYSNRGAEFVAREASLATVMSQTAPTWKVSEAFAKAAAAFSRLGQDKAGLAHLNDATYNDRFIRTVASKVGRAMDAAAVYVGACPGGTEFALLLDPTRTYPPTDQTASSVARGVANDAVSLAAPYGRAPDIQVLNTAAGVVPGVGIVRFVAADTGALSRAELSITISGVSTNKCVVWPGNAKRAPYLGRNC